LEVRQAQALSDPLTNEFTYQGRLMDSAGAPVTGPCDFRFSLYQSSAGNDPVGNVQSVSNVTLDEGYFSVGLDFGVAVFTGDGRFMKVEVDCGAGVYTTLSPRVRLTATPYALHAVSTGALHGNPVSDNLPFPDDVLTWDGNSWLPLPPANGGAYDNVIVVAKDGGQFDTIQAALDSITDENYDNRYLVWVAPGRYVEHVTMKPFVDIEGAGEWTTTIMTMGSMTETVGTVIGADAAALRSLTVLNTGGTVYAVAIVNNGTSPDLLYITAAAMGGSTKNIGVLNRDHASPLMTYVRASASGSGSTHNVGIENHLAFPTLNQVNAAATGGYISAGIYNAAGAFPKLNAVTSTGSSAQYTFGIHNIDAGAEIRESTVRADTGVIQSGIYNEWDDLPGVYIVTVEQSQIDLGDKTQPTIYIDENFVVNVGASRLGGGPMDIAPGGWVRCYGCYDEFFQNTGGIGVCP
ncbi:MAG: pectinesterase family protein, partial [Anaerolineae bacterium]|nr:pectinesterase family protein [Anaerolineae bacterium]